MHIVCNQTSFSVETCRQLPSFRISEVNPKGHYIRIINNSDAEEDLGNHFLLQRFRDAPFTVFRFPASVSVPAQGVVTIWSACGAVECNVTHCPPTDFVFSAQLVWASGPDCITILCKPNEQALNWLASPPSSTSKKHRHSYSPPPAPPLPPERADARKTGICDDFKRKDPEKRRKSPRTGGSYSPTRLPKNLDCDFRIKTAECAERKRLGCEETKKADPCSYSPPRIDRCAEEERKKREDCYSIKTAECPKHKQNDFDPCENKFSFDCNSCEEKLEFDCSSEEKRKLDSNPVDQALKECGCLEVKSKDSRSSKRGCSSSRDSCRDSDPCNRYKLHDCPTQYLYISPDCGSSSEANASAGGGSSSCGGGGGASSCSGAKQIPDCDCISRSKPRDCFERKKKEKQQLPFDCDEEEEEEEEEGCWNSLLPDCTEEEEERAGDCVDNKRWKMDKRIPCTCVHIPDKPKTTQTKKRNGCMAHPLECQSQDDCGFSPKRHSRSPSAPKRMTSPCSPKRMTSPCSPKRMTSPCSPKRMTSPCSPKITNCAPRRNDDCQSSVEKRRSPFPDCFDDVDCGDSVDNVDIRCCQDRKLKLPCEEEEDEEDEEQLPPPMGRGCDGGGLRGGASGGCGGCGGNRAAMRKRNKDADRDACAEVDRRLNCGGGGGGRKRKNMCEDKGCSKCKDEESAWSRWVKWLGSFAPPWKAGGGQEEECCGQKVPCSDAVKVREMFERRKMSKCFTCGEECQCASAKQLTPCDREVDVREKCRKPVKFSRPPMDDCCCKEAKKRRSGCEKKRNDCSAAAASAAASCGSWNDDCVSFVSTNPCYADSLTLTVASIMAAGLTVAAIYYTE